MYTGFSVPGLKLKKKVVRRSFNNKSCAFEYTDLISLEFRVSVKEREKGKVKREKGKGKS